MDIDNLAQALFGSKRAETQEVSTDGTTRTYIGRAVSDSEGGTVRVDLGGDVTLPDDLYDEDGNVVAEWDGTGIEVSTSPQVLEGEDVIVTLVGGSATKKPMVTAVAGAGDRQDERIHAIEADYVKATELEADVADIGFLKADSAVITDIQADTAKVHNLTAQEISAATGYVADLQAGSVSAQDIVAGKATVGELVADHVSVSDLDAATARIGDLEADHVSVSDFQAEQANIDSLQAATADIATIRANSAKVANLTAAELEADHATIGSLDTNYAQVNLANVYNAWIENGTVKDGAITNAMINSVSANKLTAGTIDASNINVTNLNADNLTTGTINGQRIGEGSLSLSKLEDDVYTESEVDGKLATMQAEIDGAIETWTGTDVPTLNNTPASGWTTADERDRHVGDVYFVVNSQSQQNGYNYRFTKSGSTYSWQLIKDNDVTNALQRLTTAEGKITTFDSDISTLKTDTGTLKTKTQSLETSLGDKVDVTTFNSLEDTVDGHTQTLSQHTTAISNKADSSTVTAVTNRVSKNEQDISGINTTIGELQETVEAKADGSTVSTISNKLNTVSDTVDGHTQTLTSVQNTLSSKADSSTVSTLSTKVNTIEDTVDGHTQTIGSMQTTQTTIQSTLDKTVKSSIQLWYSKANTTAPSKPTSQVTSTSTSGNAWRIVVPAYSSSYPHYYYCWQYEYVDGTYGWSAVVRDIAMGESQSTARTADSNASAAVTTANTASTNASTALTTANTASTNASEAKTAATTASTTASEAKTTAETAASDASTAKTNAASAVTTANSASTTATNAQNTANANIKSSVQLWFTKANSTAPNKPTSVVSTSNANTANAWNLVVPVWNSSYPHYFYCYQQQKGDGTYQWTDVVYDRATSEAQQLANTTSTNLSTLQTNYATFKQQTEQFESTVGTTYATKTELKGATDDITELEGRVSTNETSISNNASAIALKANSSDVYTKSGVDGLISTEVTNRNAAITAKANEITSSVSETYATKSSVNGKADASDVTALAGRVTTAESNISQNAQNIELKVSKEEFENLEIGGRNLFSWPVTGTKWKDEEHELGAYQNRGSFTQFSKSLLFDPSETVGEEYTISFDVKSPNGTTPVRLYNLNGNPKYFYFSAVSVVESLGNEWVHVEHTVTNSEFTGSSPSASDDLIRRIEVYAPDAVGVLIRKIKVEKGNKATDWTPAPEDIETRMTSAETVIEQTANNVLIKATQSDTTAAQGGQHLIESLINVAPSGVTINANKINLQGAVTISDLSSDAQSATLNSNISVGGRNLLRNTRDFAGWLTLGSYAGSATDGIWTFPAPSSLNWSNVGSPIPNFALSDYDGETLTLSFDYRSDDFSDTSGNHYVYVNVHGYASAYTGTRTKYRQISTSAFNGVFVPTTKWQRGSITFTMSENLLMSGSGTVTYFGITFYNYTLNSYQLRHVKLEKGNKATDWTPAPEDIDAAISNAAKTATSYVTEITGQNGIMVHPSTDQTTGVQITDDVNIMQDGVSVAEYGETARVGAEDSAHSVWESGEFVFNDGTYDTMKLSAPESITETHVMPSDDISYYEYIELEYPPASLISVEVDNTDYTYTPTMTPYGLKLWKDGGDGDAFDGETVVVTYKPSPAMYIYDGKGDDASNIAARINANKVSLAKDVFSFSAQYDSHSGSLSGGGIRIGDSDESLSEMVLTFSSDRSYLLFQTSASNRTAGFILDSGSTDEPERVLDLIYLDRINYVDPYGGSYRQLGKPTRLTASGSYKAGTSDTMGPAVTLTAGIWLVEGIWGFTNSSSSSKRLAVGFHRSSTGSATTWRIHTTASSSESHRLEIVDTLVVSGTSDTVTLYGSSSPASTAASVQYIMAVRLA